MREEHLRKAIVWGMGLGNELPFTHLSRIWLTARYNATGPTMPLQTLLKLRKELFDARNRNQIDDQTLNDVLTLLDAIEIMLREVERYERYGVQRRC